MKNFGTNVVAIVTLGKAGKEVHGVSIINTVQEGVDETYAITSLMSKSKL